MSAIGDIFLRLAIDDTGFHAQVVGSAGKAGEAAGAALGTRMSAGLKRAGSSILAGLGLGAGLSFFNALQRGVQDVTRVIGDSIEAAKADKVSFAALRAELEANDQAFTGDTRAIEASLTSRVKLGYTMTEQRAQLAALVAITQDHTSALAIERISMDVAAATGRDFGSVNLALGKAYVGNATALKRLGIVVQAGVKGMDLLNIVQARYVGAAQAVVEADPSKALAANAELLSVKFGKVLLPIEEALVGFGNNVFLPFLSRLIDSFGTIGSVLSFLTPAFIAGAAAITYYLLPSIIALTVASAALLVEWAPIIVTGLLIAGMVALISGGMKDTGTQARLTGSGMSKWGGVMKQTAKDVKGVSTELDNLGKAGATLPGWGHHGPPALEGLVQVMLAIPDELQKAGDKANAVIGSWATGFSATLADGTVLFSNNASELADSLPQAVIDAKARAEAEAAKVPKGLADAILGKKDDFDAIKKAISDALVGGIEDGKARRIAAAYLASHDVTKGLLSGSTETRLAMLSVVDQLATSIDTLIPDALATGQGVPTAYAKGVKTNLAAMIAALDKIRSDSGSHLDLADFAEQMGYAGIAAYIRGMKQPDVKTPASTIAANAAKALKGDLSQEGKDTARSWLHGFMDSSTWNALPPWLRQAFTNLLGPGAVVHVPHNVPPPTYQEGTLQVPRTGLAMLHQGELVAPAPAAAALRSFFGGGVGMAAGGGGVSIAHLEINGVGSDVSAQAARGFARQVMDDFAAQLRDQAAQTVRLRAVEF